MDDIFYYNAKTYTRMKDKRVILVERGKLKDKRVNDGEAENNE